VVSGNPSNIRGISSFPATPFIVCHVPFVGQVVSVAHVVFLRTVIHCHRLSRLSFLLLARRLRSPLCLVVRFLIFTSFIVIEIIVEGVAYI
jgi:hypothetical protein